MSYGSEKERTFTHFCGGRDSITIPFINEQVKIVETIVQIALMKI